ncbi:hypothetical protein JCM8097_008607 [Rhodosporidiobolus ruineniae]
MPTLSTTMAQWTTKGKQPRVDWIALSFDGVDRLSALPAELIDRIFDFVELANNVKDYATGGRVYDWRTGNRGPRMLPISKRFLPTQRRRYARLTLQEPEDSWHFPQLLSQCDNLNTLECSAFPDLSAVLALLPNPERLYYLSITAQRHLRYSDVSATAHALSTVLAKLTNLTRLFLDCPCDLADSSLHQTFAQSGLEHLAVGPECSGSVAGTDVLRLVSGDESIPTLRYLELNIAEGRRGEDFQWGNLWRIEETWKLPDWPCDFGEADVDKLVKAGKAAGIMVFGDAVCAVGLREQYARMRDDVEKARRLKRLAFGEETEDEGYEAEEI